jgi:hypothetical protein
VLDFVTHRPDMPLYPGSKTLVGLGLWNSLWGTVTVEGLMFVAGVALYLKTTRAKNRAGAISFFTLVALLLLLYIGSMVGPPPPNVMAIVIVGFLSWLVILWAYRIDRRREPVTA